MKRVPKTMVELGVDPWDDVNEKEFTGCEA